MSLKCAVLAGLLSGVLFIVAGQDQGPTPVTDACLGCICEASSECNLTIECSGDSCGSFHITRAYWTDAAHSSCTLDPWCAARTVQGYMTRYGQDCNHDRKINCYDYMIIHKNGPEGCKRHLSSEYSIRFQRCAGHVNVLRT